MMYPEGSPARWPVLGGPDHSVLTREEWEQAKSSPPKPFIGSVIDREDCCLPPWFVPSARGVAVVSDDLLEGFRGKAAPRIGYGKPWKEVAPDVFLQVRVPRDRIGALLVRRFEGSNIWTIRCWNPGLLPRVLR